MDHVPHVYVCNSVKKTNNKYQQMYGTTTMMDAGVCILISLSLMYGDLLAGMLHKHRSAKT